MKVFCSMGALTPYPLPLAIGLFKISKTYAINAGCTCTSRDYRIFINKANAYNERFKVLR